MHFITWRGLDSSVLAVGGASPEPMDTDGDRAERGGEEKKRGKEEYNRERKKRETICMYSLQSWSQTSSIVSNGEDVLPLLCFTMSRICRMAIGDGAKYNLRLTTSVTWIPRHICCNFCPRKSARPVTETHLVWHADVKIVGGRAHFFGLCSAKNKLFMKFSVKFMFVHLGSTIVWNYNSKLDTSINRHVQDGNCRDSCSLCK